MNDVDRQIGGFRIEHGDARNAPVSMAQGFVNGGMDGRAASHVEPGESLVSTQSDLQSRNQRKKGACLLCILLYRYIIPIVSILNIEKK